jgi:hypothetical protein
LTFIEFLEVVDLHFDVGTIDVYNFFIKVLDFFLEILDFLIHLLDILLPLPEILSAFVFLLFEVLFKETEITRTLVVDPLATALSTDRTST